MIVYGRYFGVTNRYHSNEVRRGRVHLGWVSHLSADSFMRRRMEAGTTNVLQAGQLPRPVTEASIVRCSAEPVGTNKGRIVSNRKALLFSDRRVAAVACEPWGCWGALYFSSRIPFMTGPLTSRSELRKGCYKGFQLFSPTLDFGGTHGQ
jgi:hypothetical protein